MLAICSARQRQTSWFDISSCGAILPGRARAAAEVPAEQAAQSLDAAPAAAVPPQRRPNYRDMNAYQTRTQLRQRRLLRWALQQLLDQRG